MSGVINKGEEELARQLSHMLSDQDTEEKILGAIDDDDLWEKLTREGRITLGGAGEAVDLEDEQVARRVATLMEESSLVWWCGMYTAESPDWMKKKGVAVTGKAGSIQIDGEEIEVSGQEGNYTWAYGGKNFSVSFWKEYGEDGTLKDIWMEGEIFQGDKKEHFKAKMECADEFRGLSSITTIKEWSTFIGIIGSFLTLKTVYDIFTCKSKKASEAAAETKATLDSLKELEIRQLDRNIRQDVAEDLTRSEGIIQNEVDKAIGDEIDRHIREYPKETDIDSKVEELKEKLSEYKRAVDAQVKISAAASFERIYSRETRGVVLADSVKDAVMDRVTGALAEKMCDGMAGDYLDSVVRERVSAGVVERLRDTIAEMDARLQETRLAMSEQTQRILGRLRVLLKAALQKRKRRQLWKI